MKSILLLFSCLFALMADSAPEARIAYFKTVREVRVGSRDRQNFAVVDEAVWKDARPDLGDLRLYSGAREVPYALVTQGRGQEAKRSDARLLNVGRANGITRFDLDVGTATEYDEITFGLADTAKDFVARARVEGLDDLKHSRGVDLGTSTLFDFSREKLGSSSSLRLARPVTFRFLRISVPALLPAHILRATVSDTRVRPSNWTRVPVSPRIEQSGRMTVITSDIPEELPLARVLFQVDPSQTSFRRSVQIQDEDGRSIAAGEISRIHITREGKPVDAEALALEFPDVHVKRVRAVIENGDDPPLPISQVSLFTLERRIYFEPKGNSSLLLYVGDPKLNNPIYDYAKFFRPDDSATQASLGPSKRNPRYSGRPDNRPWTERHPALLWCALVLAVLGLGGIAIRSMRKTGQPV